LTVGIPVIYQITTLIVNGKAPKKRISLSDALRAFLDKLAATEKVMTKEETWLKEQIEETFSRVDKGEIRYYSEDEADERMNSFISKIEHQHETA